MIRESRKLSSRIGRRNEHLEQGAAPLAAVLLPANKEILHTAGQGIDRKRSQSWR